MAAGESPAANRPARQRTGRKRGFDRLDDRRRFGHPAGTELAAGHRTVVRADESDAVGLQPLDVPLGRRVQPHPHVHRRGDEHPLVGRQQKRVGEVVGEAARHSRQQVGAGRGDHDEIGRARKFDMADQRLVGQTEKLVPDRLAAQRRGRQRRDELARRPPSSRP